MRHTSQTFIFVLGVKLKNIVTDQIILNELSKLVLISRSRSNDELNTYMVTLAVEVLILGSASDLSMSEN